MPKLFRKLSSKLGNLKTKLGNLYSKLQGKPKPIPPTRIGSTGHRGVAAGDLRRREAANERFLAEGGTTPWTAEEVAKWETLSPLQVDRFLYDFTPLVVNSSNVVSAQYYNDSNELRIQFKDGSAYIYEDINTQEALEFAKAFSKGGWVWDYLRIRGTKYGHKKPYKKTLDKYKKRIH